MRQQHRRFALLALGRTGEPRPIWKKLRRKKLPEWRTREAQSPASNAYYPGALTGRFVGHIMVFQKS